MLQQMDVAKSEVALRMRLLYWPSWRRLDTAWFKKMGKENLVVLPQVIISFEIMKLE